MTKNNYCTLDTETLGGASGNEIVPIYHLGGIIHDRLGNMIATFNYLIMEHFENIRDSFYGKGKVKEYLNMIDNGIATAVSTEEEAIEAVDSLLSFYNVKYLMAYNSGFDFGKTNCKSLIENRQFVDIWLMAVQTITHRKKYATFCRENGFRSSSKRSVSTTAQTVYAYLTNNAEYKEEHTAFEDSKIELQIFLACQKQHMKYTKNKHCFDCHEENKFFPSFSAGALN